MWVVVFDYSLDHIVIVAIEENIMLEVYVFLQCLFVDFLLVWMHDVRIMVVHNLHLVFYMLVVQNNPLFRMVRSVLARLVQLVFCYIRVVGVQENVVVQVQIAFQGLGVDVLVDRSGVYVVVGVQHRRGVGVVVVVRAVASVCNVVFSVQCVV